MTPFTYERASDAQAALTLGAQPDAKYLGGGTNLVDLMRETIEHPSMLIDITGLSRGIDETNDGGLRTHQCCSAQQRATQQNTTICAARQRFVPPSSSLTAIEPQG